MGGDLPHARRSAATLDVFPLTGVLLLPRGQLPLNIFEPRYLALVDAALSGDRLIGMIQPTQHEDKVLKPALSAIGCAGRLTVLPRERRRALSDHADRRLPVPRRRGTADRARRTARSSADFAPFLGDLAAADETDFPRDRLLAALKDYLSRRDLKADWHSVLGAPPETLVNALAMLCPFEPAEKQALLEAPGWPERVDTLIALLEMANAGPPGPVSLN